jgi:alkaline phosphatase
MVRASYLAPPGGTTVWAEGVREVRKAFFTVSEQLWCIMVCERTSAMTSYLLRTRNRTGSTPISGLLGLTCILALAIAGVYYLPGMQPEPQPLGPAGPDVRAGEPVQGLAAKNVILLIGDGMGQAQIDAAGLYAHGRTGRLTLEQLPHRGLMSTHPAGGDPKRVTDSAAAGTALATGRKVNNKVISVAIPGDGAELETVLQRAGRHGRKTGLVSTSVITHATPAAFGAHCPDRNKYDKIAESMLTGVRPNLIFGAAGVKDKEGNVLGVTPDKARKAGYTVVQTRKEMARLEPGQLGYVSGQFHAGGHMPYMHEYKTGKTDVYDTVPTLSEMTAKALELLGGSEGGFFLMVEAARIDHAGHGNKIEQNMAETLEFDRAVAEVLDWAKGRTDTLVIVTADHECGGLRVDPAGARQGEIPSHTWSSDGHTGVFVPIFASGVGAGSVRDVIDNTDVYRVMIGEKISPRKLSDIPAGQIPGMPEPKKPAEAGAETY